MKIEECQSPYANEDFDVKIRDSACASEKKYYWLRERLPHGMVTCAPRVMDEEIAKHFSLTLSTIHNQTSPNTPTNMAVPFIFHTLLFNFKPLQTKTLHVCLFFPKSLFL